MSTTIPFPQYDPANRDGFPPIISVTASVTEFLGKITGTQPNLHFTSRYGVVLPRNARYQVGTSSVSLLLQTANACYDLHQPFSLAPEVVWYTILHEVATTVKESPAKYAGLYTTQPDSKQIIRVQVNDFVYGQQNDWTAGVAQFDAALREKVPDGIMDRSLLRFSTSTPETDVTLLLTFMDAASPFYDYRMETMCGIPAIRLEGTAEDWRKIQKGAAALSEAFPALQAYFNGLLPILKEIADTAEGKAPDLQFWENMFKENGGSGGPYISGWMANFLCYKYIPASSALGRTHQVPQLRDDAAFARRSYGITSSCIPAHISQVDFIWEYYDREIPMQFAAGILGVEKDADGFYCPRLGFAIIEKAA